MKKVLSVYLLLSLALTCYCQDLDHKIAAIEKGLTGKDSREKVSSLAALKKLQNEFGVEATYQLIPALGISRSHAPNRQFQLTVDTLLEKYPDRKKVLFYHLESLKSLHEDVVAQGHILAYCLKIGHLVSEEVAAGSNLVPIIVDHVIVVQTSRNLKDQMNYYAIAAAVQTISLYYDFFPKDVLQPSTIKALTAPLYKDLWSNEPVWSDAIAIMSTAREGMITALKFMNTDRFLQSRNPQNSLGSISRRLTRERASEKDIEALLISMINRLKGKDELTDEECCRIILKMGHAAKVFIAYLTELQKSKESSLSQIAAKTLKYLETQN